MKRLLIAAAALLALYCVPAARAQTPDYTYPDADYRSPTDPTQFASWAVDGVIFPYLGTDGLLTADFMAYYYPDLFDGYTSTGEVTLSGVTFGPPGVGTGEGSFAGDAGYSQVVVRQFGGTGSHQARISVGTVSSLSFGPMASLIGGVTVFVIPMTPNMATMGPPPPPTMAWYPVGFCTLPGITPVRAQFFWETTITVPYGSEVVVVYTCGAVGCYLNDAVNPGVGASAFIL